MDVTAVLLPLLGVALGTVGTLTGQYLATRGEARRHATERAAATRAELKDAIVAYLDAVQSVEQLIDTGTGRADVDDLLHAMWLRKKVLELLSDEPLAHTAHRYTSTLHQLAVAPAAPSLALTTSVTPATGVRADAAPGATGTPTPTGGQATGATVAGGPGGPAADGPSADGPSADGPSAGASAAVGGLAGERKRLRAEFMGGARAALRV